MTRRLVLSLASIAASLAAAGCGPTPYLLTLLGLSGGGSGSSHVDQPPALSAITPEHSQTGGVAKVPFRIADPENDPVVLTFTYSVDGRDFVPATAAAGTPANPVPAPVAGQDYFFFWDTAADKVPNSGDVIVAIEASDGRVATRIATGTFSVVNDPIVMSVAGLATGSLWLPLLEPAEALVSIAARAGCPPFPANTGPDYAFDLLAHVAAGLKPYFFSMTVDPPLGGLALDAGTGRLTGHPSRSGTFRVTIKVTDATPAEASATFELDVRPAVRIAAGALPPAVPLVDYRERVAVRGGKGDFTFKLVGGSLPGTIVLDADGTVHGTPPDLGSLPSMLSSFTVQATDGLGFTTTRPVKLRVAPARPLAAVQTVVSASAGSRTSTGMGRTTSCAWVRRPRRPRRRPAAGVFPFRR